MTRSINYVGMSRITYDLDSSCSEERFRIMRRELSYAFTQYSERFVVLLRRCRLRG